MNLWVRTLRQLTVASVALFFFSCEDETSLLGFKNPNKKFHVGYVDIPLNSSTVLAIDSLVTDLRPILVVDANSSQRGTVAVDGLLVGQYQDPQLGNVTAQTFLTIYPTINNALQATAVYDSITVQFRLNFQAYGFTGSQRKTINIHQITGDTLTLYGGRSYYANSAAPQYSAEPLGQAVVNVHFDSLRKQVALAPSRQDTVFATGRLSDAFGTQMFEAIRAGFTTSAEQRFFKYQIKGLALLPGEESGVLGMNVIDQNVQGHLSRVILHYHTLDASGAVDDTLSRSFGTDFASFTRIEADRSATELASLPSYQSMEPGSGLRYVQSGAPLVTKLDLTPFYAFADTVENIVINSAELVIDNVNADPGMPPHSVLALRLMNNEADQFLNTRIVADRERMIPYFIYNSGRVNEPYVYAATQDPSTGPVTLQFDNETNRYSGFMTIFTQSLFMNKNDDGGVNVNRLKFLTLYPQSPAANRSITRTIFGKDDVKLRIFYTRANTVSP